jgi:hypothetical protein
MVDHQAPKARLHQSLGHRPRATNEIDASAESALQPTDLPIDPTQAVPE